MQQSDLKPGDIMLYSPSSIFGVIIKLKTWHSISHCEVYFGNGLSHASRDGVGVGEYPVRFDQLCHVIRPVKYDTARAEAYYKTVAGIKYGWLELANFIGIPVRNKGMFCSEYVVYDQRAAGNNIFPSEDPSCVAPFELELLVEPEGYYSLIL
jgi:hypothetical protein